MFGIILVAFYPSVLLKEVPQKGQMNLFLIKASWMPIYYYILKKYIKGTKMSRNKKLGLA